MIRSQLIRLARLVNSRGSLKVDFQRSCGKVSPSSSQVAAHRDFHLTSTRQDDSQNSSDASETPKLRPRPQNKKRVVPKVDKELKQAAVNVAKSLPGDWTKTAEELLARLSTHQEPKIKPDTVQPGETQPSEDAGETSLLKTMQVGRGFKGQRGRGEEGEQQRKSVRNLLDDDFYNRSTQTTTVGKPAPVRARRIARKTEVFKELFATPRLGIFDAEKAKSQVDETPQALGLGLWEQVDAENLRKMQGGLPRNAFEEMIEWTRQGKMWTFPVDNEADMHEERQYKFHEHVFLEGHLADFPDRGPIRKFMELVVLGLSQNPWLTVPEKKEHVRWFADYFRDKQDVLEASLGQEGKMKEKSQEIE